MKVVLARSLVLLLLLLGVASADGYVRLSRDKDGTPKELQTGIARFRLQDVTVDLVAVIHVGEKEYYQRLDKHLNNYESVLYEMVLDVPKSVSHQNDVRAILGKDKKEPVIDTSRGGKDSVSLFQQKLASTLGLAFQLPEMNYNRANFHHADLTLAEFDAAMAGKQKSAWQVLKDLFQIGNMNGPAEYKQLAKLPLMKILAEGPSADEQRALRIGIGALLADSDDLVQDEVVIGRRNEKTMEVLAERRKRGEKQFAIFYGAAHMDDFSRRLREQGFKPESKVWIRAWKL